MSRLACFKWVWVAILIVLPAFIVANAQVPPPTYEKSTEVRLKGVVGEVKIDADNNLHLTMKSGREVLDVWIAPEKFLKLTGIIFHKGDPVEVLGSRLTVGGAALLLAREVTRDTDVVTLRDDEGQPVWVGWIE